MRHECKNELPKRAYGEAIFYCNEDASGNFWIGNGEYESQVNFCPFCGKQATKVIKGLNFFEHGVFSLDQKKVDLSSK